MDLGQIAKDYGGHILGFLGLVQLWIIALARRLTSGRLDVYETGTIETGFSSFGSTVNLMGTLRTHNKDVFVKRMRIRIIRTEDKAEHRFSWRAFRPLTFSPGAAGAAPTFTFAGSFLVPTVAPRQYNVFFASEAFSTQYLSHVQPVRDAWLSFLGTQSASADLFDAFVKAGHATPLHTAISNGFFWHAGGYQLEFTIETDNRRTTTTRRWGFSLSTDDEQKLRLNVISMIREICNLPVVYNFIYKDYPPS